MSKAKVLFLAADPFSVAPDGQAPRLRLDEDLRQIRRKVGIAKDRDGVEFDMRLVARTDDVLRALSETRPQVVHFSGHGGGDGLVLTSEVGRAARAGDAQRLAEILAAYHGDIRVVMLSACFSQPQAEAIASVIGCVIGTPSTISDEAVIAFDSSFYRSVSFGNSVAAAFEQARAALALEQWPAMEFPKMVVRSDVDPAELVLIGDSAGELFGGANQSEEDLLVIADLDAAPVEVTIELMGALDELHRALGGGGLVIRTAHAGSTAAVGLPA